MRLSYSFLFLSASTVLVHANVANTLVTQTRRLLNLGGLFGSATQTDTPYERVAGYPVFQVTTAWGSAYMNMEKKSDMDSQEDSAKTSDGAITSISEEQGEYRTVCLYFMDPEDAVSVHAELKQMQQMEKSDIRITAGSLTKALRQAGNLGNGLVTGAPVDPLTGNLKPVDEGGSLRYKIMPSKRQLYYAARCIGKERVGLFGEGASDDAMTAILGNSALESMNLEMRRDKRERKGPRKAKTLVEAQNAHMEGYIGIPVFYCPSIRKQQPRLKQLISGSSQEQPMFFNYEDLVDAWGKMKKQNPSQNLSDKPPSVEVFNLWDVLTSMEKDAWKQKRVAADKSDWFLNPIRKRLQQSKEQPGLESVTFIPSSRSIDYKEAISKRGNGKARLRPMRG